MCPFTHSQVQPAFASKPIVIAKQNAKITKACFMITSFLVPPPSIKHGSQYHYRPEAFGNARRIAANTAKMPECGANVCCA